VLQLLQFVVLVVPEGVSMFEVMVSGKFIAGIVVFFVLVIQVLISVVGAPLQMHHMKLSLQMKAMMMLNSTKRIQTLMMINQILILMPQLLYSLSILRLWQQFEGFTTTQVTGATEGLLVLWSLQVLQLKQFVQQNISSVRSVMKGRDQRLVDQLLVLDLVMLEMWFSQTWFKLKTLLAVNIGWFMLLMVPVGFRVVKF
jgi:hypothetical protein